MTPRQVRANWLTAQRQQEKALTATVGAFFRDQGKWIVQELDAAGDVSGDVLRQIFDPEAENEKFLEAIGPRLAQTMARGARELLARVKTKSRKDRQMTFGWELEGILLDLSPEVRAAIEVSLRDLAAQPYWVAIQNDSLGILTEIVQHGLEEGFSTYKIGMNIREEMGGMPANKRAQRIARTEASAALNAGHQAEANELAAARSASADMRHRTRDTGHCPPGNGCGVAVRSIP